MNFIFKLNYLESYWDAMMERVKVGCAKVEYVCRSGFSVRGRPYFDGLCQSPRKPRLDGCEVEEGSVC